MTEEQIKKAILDIEKECKKKDDTIDTEKFYQRIKGLTTILKDFRGGGISG